MEIMWVITTLILIGMRMEDLKLTNVINFKRKKTWDKFLQI